MGKRTSPTDLIKLHKAREKIRDKNSRRPAHLRQTDKQIEKSTRRALDDGRINDHGFVLKKE
tara:strand:- start:3966 stop:4151 length:186 start_codon:yes stop_codon:yes gene_type:complete